jgi:hypothetical protein
MPDISIQGIQEAQRDNLRMIRALEPGGALGQAVQATAIDAHRYTVSITHVDTGSLRASHRIDYSSMGSDEARANIYIDPGSVNPRSHAKPSVYGIGEEDRGGTHAFYDRTLEERGERSLEIGALILERGLDG